MRWQLIASLVNLDEISASQPELLSGPHQSLLTMTHAGKNLLDDPQAVKLVSNLLDSPAEFA